MGIRDVLTLRGPPAAWWNMFLAVVLTRILLRCSQKGGPAGLSFAISTEPTHTTTHDNAQHSRNARTQTRRNKNTLTHNTAHNTQTHRQRRGHTSKTHSHTKMNKTLASNPNRYLQRIVAYHYYYCHYQAWGSPSSSSSSSSWTLRTPQPQPRSLADHASCTAALLTIPQWTPSAAHTLLQPLVFFNNVLTKKGIVQIRKTQDEPQWIVAQGLLSALTIPGFS